MEDDHVDGRMGPDHIESACPAVPAAQKNCCIEADHVQSACRAVFAAVENHCNEDDHVACPCQPA
eukprot:5659022-Karenia_brevis.AAC.1